MHNYVYTASIININTYSVVNEHFNIIITLNPIRTHILKIDTGSVVMTPIVYSSHCMYLVHKM